MKEGQELALSLSEQVPLSESASSTKAQGKASFKQKHTRKSSSSTSLATGTVIIDATLAVEGSQQQSTSKHTQSSKMAKSSPKKHQESSNKPKELGHKATAKRPPHGHHSRPCPSIPSSSAASLPLQRAGLTLTGGESASVRELAGGNDAAESVAACHHPLRGVGVASEPVMRGRCESREVEETGSVEQGQMEVQSSFSRCV